MIYEIKLNSYSIFKDVKKYRKKMISVAQLCS